MLFLTENINFLNKNINFLNKNAIFCFVGDGIEKFKQITIADFQFKKDKDKKKFKKEHFDAYNFNALMEDAKKLVIKKHDELVKIYDEWIEHYKIDFYKDAGWETYEIPPKYRKIIPKKKNC